MSVTPGVADRIQKLLSREFLIGMGLILIATLALFLLSDKDGNPAVSFGDWAFWASIFGGIPTGALTVQKAAATLKRGPV